jgi:hypothetical protein
MALPPRPFAQEVAEKVHPLRSRSSEILTYDPVFSGFQQAVEFPTP